MQEDAGSGAWHVPLTHVDGGRHTAFVHDCPSVAAALHVPTSAAVPVKLRHELEPVHRTGDWAIESHAAPTEANDASMHVELPPSGFDTQ
jgi:hypothetical protein